MAEAVHDAKRLKAAAEEAGISVNEALNRLIEAALQENE